MTHLTARSYARIAIILSCMVIAALNVTAPTAAAPAEASSQSPTSKLEWRNIGPFIGGRVVALAAVPGTTNTFYFGGVDGGVWKSTNYGISWTNITDGALPGDSNSIGALAVAPSNSKIIYAGTGESDIRGDFITGDGVFKSTDAGKTWHAAGLADTHTISKVVVDPNDPGVVYVSSMGHVFRPNDERGVFKSTDGGKKWQKSLFVDAGTGAVDLVMDPKNPKILYAAMWQAYRNAWSLSSGGPGSGLYKTTDGGAHWTNISHANGFPQGILGKIGVTVAASDPRVVYAIVQAKEGGVFRSADSGATWTRTNADWSLRQRAFYYIAIFADPTDPNTVYAPQVDALWVSHDGAKTFAKLHTPHGDNHIVWIDPKDPRILLEGNDGGATVSTDGGLTWSDEHNQPTGQFYHVGVDDRFPFHVYGAQQDEGSSAGPTAAAGGGIGAGDWHAAAYGESTFVAPQPDNPLITYGSGYFSIFMRHDEALDEYADISPWPDYREGAASEELKYRLGWTHPIVFSAANPKKLFVGSQFVLESDDYGQTWKEISPDLTRNDPATEGPTGGPIDLDQTSAEVYPDVEALAVSPLNGSEIWAGSSDGLVHVTTDAGAHWQSATPPALPQRAEITSIEPSHTDDGTAYLTASRYLWDDFRPYVYETSDFGKTWRTIAEGIPSDQYAFVIRQDPNDAQLLLAGTKSSVYYSADGGARWQQLSLNLPAVQVRDLQIDARQRAVAIATHGRAFWVLDDLALLEQLTKPPAGELGGLRLFAPSTAWLTHEFGASPFPRQSTGTNPPFGATVYYSLPPGYDGSAAATLSFTDSQGHVIRTFSLHAKSKQPKPSQKTQDNWTPAEVKAYADGNLTAAAAGMNRFQWDLRYPEATEVRGFYVPVPAGGLPDVVSGPVVVPGTYGVTLSYAGQEVRQSFEVSLDPRIQAAPDALAARLDLGLRIHAALDALDTKVNEAMTAREALAAAIARHKSASDSASATLAQLDARIGDLVQLDLHSSEGPLIHEIKLRSRLAYLAADIDLSYGRPTTAQDDVFADLEAKATAGERALEQVVAAAKQLMQ
ncbi:MAG TPA: hypothetical protein VID19_08905 [Candidatus Eremiobacteraceae bacterium]